MHAESSELPFELDPSLEIPGDDAIAVFRRGFVPHLAARNRTLQHAAKFRLELTIERKRQKLRGGTAAGERIEVRFQLHPNEVVAHASLMFL